jgi:uncharacterized protein YndB with AHSA1/START domain
MASSTDRIEKAVLLRAPLARVWRAISAAKEFGTWFGAEFDGEFVAGTRLTGRIMPTRVDAEIAKSQRPYAGTAFEIRVERVEPMRLLSFRWRPFGVDADASGEPTTLVELELEEVAGGTRLMITESGFDRIPPERRAKAFTANEEGWTAQAKLIEKYLSARERG